MFADRRSRLLLVVFPLASWLLLLWLFWPRVPHDLPIAVLDADGSALSRQLTRAIDATPSIRVAYAVTDQGGGRDLVLRGQAYAVLAIPAGLEASVLRGDPDPVQLFYNTQLLTAGNLVARDARLAAGTLSVTLAAGRRALQGENTRLAVAAANPIGTELHPLFNPSMDYARFLGLTLVAALLHIFAVVAGADACGRELRERTAGAWFEASGRSAFVALAGKLAPYALWFAALGSAVLLTSMALLRIEMAGSVVLLLLGWCVFGIASLGLGAFLIGCTANLRMATSIASLIISPALAFSGLTFPAWSMPVMIKLWSALLPLTHYLTLHVQQVSMGAGAANAWLQMLPLLAFAVLPFVLLPRWQRLLSQPAYWGRA
ncbi:ABC transporter permease [Lysobacter cavernae]|uniref:ABC transporter permease n=1 Tax=Lysobacter cavernae TaxID=1685901 RepID=A0ABV7RS30_9GAMM